MLSWFMGLTLPWRLGILAAVGLAIFLSIRYYTNAVWEKGFQQGKVQATQEIEKSKKEEWSKREADLATKSSLLNSREAQLGNQMAEVVKSRQFQLETLAQIRAIATAKKDSDVCWINTLSGSELDAAIRAAITELSPAAK